MSQKIGICGPTASIRLLRSADLYLWYEVNAQFTLSNNTILGANVQTLSWGLYATVGHELGFWMLYVNCT